MSGEFRIILLVLGLVIILVIYFKTRSDSGKTSTNDKRVKSAPDPSIHLRKITQTEEGRIVGESEQGAEGVSEGIVAGAQVGAQAGTTSSEVAEEANEGMTASAQQDAQDINANRDETPPPIIAERAGAPAGASTGSPAESSAEQPIEPPAEASTETPTEAPATDKTAATPETTKNETETTGLGRRLKNHFNDTLQRLFQNDQKPGDPEIDDDVPLLVLHIRAPSDRAFYGREVLAAAERVGLRRAGANDGSGPFEKVVVDENGQRHIRFYMADMFEPGVFEWAPFDETRVLGLSLFTRLVDQHAAVNVFDEMVACARNVSAMLEGAALLDDKHSTLTNQTISHMRESLREEANKSHFARA